MILVALAFLVVLGGVLGAYWAFIVKPEQHSAETLKRRLKGAPSPVKRKGSKILRDQDDNALGGLDALLNRITVSKSLTDLVEQSGVKMTVGSLLVASALFGVIAFIIGFVAFRMAAA